jgi:hypothetical protein
MNTTEGDWTVAFAMIAELPGLHLAVGVQEGENWRSLALLSPIATHNAEDTANAHMMSAAKDMYTVLKALVNLMGAKAPPDAVAAIRKAEGGPALQVTGKVHILQCDGCQRELHLPVVCNPQGIESVQLNDMPADWTFTTERRWRCPDCVK